MKAARIIIPARTILKLLNLPVEASILLVERCGDDIQFFFEGVGVECDPADIADDLPIIPLDSLQQVPS